MGEVHADSAAEVKAPATETQETMEGTAPAPGNCPYLGRRSDPWSLYGYPTAHNVCHHHSVRECPAGDRVGHTRPGCHLCRSRKPQFSQILLHVQRQFCLTPDHVLCEIYLQRKSDSPDSPQ
ncbi:MAG: hypothetical protein HY318_18700 [Armatimonadetes bacterium]|nr:hypothetical protein [Armatimonadota bacterium]